MQGRAWAGRLALCFRSLYGFDSLTAETQFQGFTFSNRKKKPQVIVAEATCDSEVDGSVQWTFRQNMSVTSMNHDEALEDVESTIKDGRHGVKRNLFSISDSL